jgi:hypothetical protein
MTKPRVAIVGAGLCGSVLAARLRNAFDVTVVEQARTPRPLRDDVDCAGGGVTTTINRGAGLGGTTKYWHNALIELAPDELRGCGIDSATFAAYYRRALSLFLSDAQVETCDAIRNASAAEGVVGRTAHMVVPQARANVWELADKAWHGDPVSVVYGRALRAAVGANGAVSHLIVETPSGMIDVAADHFIFSAGGLATPVLLAASFRSGETLCGGYHDHPMAYVAKIRLRPGSALKRVSCVETGPASVRTGFVYEAAGLQAVFYLRPALNLNTASIMGEARYILSDLRNDPFSPRKLMALVRNVEALREAVMFKARAGFLGDYYSLLMFGEQEPLDSRGVRCTPGKVPALNWHVTDTEHAAYQDCLQQFLVEQAAELVDHNVIPGSQWQYRTGAHHSGASRDFTAERSTNVLGFFAANDASNLSICDGSILRRGGIANSGLTLVALSHQLADALIGT